MKLVKDKRNPFYGRFYPFRASVCEDVHRGFGEAFRCSPGPRNLLYHLVRRLDYEGFISLTPAARERIALACGIDVRTMSNYLTTLCKTDVLRHAGRGEYLMNPNFFLHEANGKKSPVAVKSLFSRSHTNWMAPAR